MCGLRDHLALASGLDCIPTCTVTEVRKGSSILSSPTIPPKYPKHSTWPPLRRAASELPSNLICNVISKDEYEWLVAVHPAWFSNKEERVKRINSGEWDVRYFSLTWPNPRMIEFERKRKLLEAQRAAYEKDKRLLPMRLEHIRRQSSFVSEWQKTPDILPPGVAGPDWVPRVENEGPSKLASAKVTDRPLAESPEGLPSDSLTSPFVPSSVTHNDPQPATDEEPASPCVFYTPHLPVIEDTDANDVAPIIQGAEPEPESEVEPEVVEPETTDISSSVSQERESNAPSSILTPATSVSAVDSQAIYQPPVASDSVVTFSSFEAYARSFHPPPPPVPGPPTRTEVLVDTMVNRPARYVGQSKVVTGIRRAFGWKTREERLDQQRIRALRSEILNDSPVDRVRYWARSRWPESQAVQQVFGPRLPPL